MPVKLHLMLASPLPQLSALIKMAELVCPTQISREDLSSMRAIVYQDSPGLPGDECEINIDECQCFPCFRGTLTMSLTQARVPLVKITNSENKSLYNRK